MTRKHDEDVHSTEKAHREEVSSLDTDAFARCCTDLLFGLQVAELQRRLDLGTRGEVREAVRDERERWVTKVEREAAAR